MARLVAVVQVGERRTRVILSTETGNMFEAFVSSRQTLPTPGFEVSPYTHAPVSVTGQRMIQRRLAGREAAAEVNNLSRSASSTYEVGTRVFVGDYVPPINFEGASQQRPRRNTPSDAELAEMLLDSWAKATDGCVVEHDGTCPHGCKSWLLELGMT